LDAIGSLAVPVPGDDRDVLSVQQACPESMFTYVTNSDSALTLCPGGFRNAAVTVNYVDQPGLRDSAISRDRCAGSRTPSHDRPGYGSGGAIDQFFYCAVAEACVLMGEWNDDGSV